MDPRTQDPQNMDPNIYKWHNYELPEQRNTIDIGSTHYKGHIRILINPA